jgi:hypothetical protein
LYEHFTSISGSISKDGLIDKAEFKKALGMKESLFVDRVFTLFDKDTSGARAATLRSALPPAACSHKTAPASASLIPPLQAPSTFGNF